MKKLIFLKGAKPEIWQDHGTKFQLSFRLRSYWQLDETFSGSVAMGKYTFTEEEEEEEDDDDLTDMVKS